MKHLALPGFVNCVIPAQLIAPQLSCKATGQSSVPQCTLTNPNAPPMHHNALNQPTRTPRETTADACNVCTLCCLNATVTVISVTQGSAPLDDLARIQLSETETKHWM